jgi:predicted Zn-dependent peptidase
MTRPRVLSNGLRVVAERVPGARSCGIGLWLEAGSRHEGPEERGVTHFIEHMLFKGTTEHDVHALADAMNLLGGNVNAFTSQEVLCLHAKTIDAKAHLALDLICEMLTTSTFPVDEIRRERQVVIEECRMVEDEPDDYCVDLFMRSLWPGHPLGEPVIGRRGIIRRFQREQVTSYWRRVLRPDRLVVAVAGAFDAEAVEDVIRRRLGSLPTPNARQPACPGRHRPVPCPRPSGAVLARPIEQAYFCLGCVGPRRASPDRFAFGLLNMVLGGGLNSRLFREIREKRGLAYSIGSFTQGFSDVGSFAVTGGASPRSLGEVLSITRAEIDRACEESILEAELEMARAQVLDAIVMGLENTESRAARLADGVLSLGRVPSVDEVMDRVARVNAGQARRVARHYLRARPMAMGLIGPPGNRRLAEQALGWR